VIIGIEKSQAEGHSVRVIRELTTEEAKAELAQIDEQLLQAKTALQVKRAIEGIIYAKKDTAAIRPGV